MDNTMKWILFTIGIACLMTATFAICYDTAKQSQQVVVKELPSSQMEVEVVDPSYTTYKGSSQTMERKVESVRICSPFGLSPGEVIARMEPMKMTDKGDADVRVGPTGVNSEGGGDVTMTSGGFRYGIFDTIWGWIKRAGFWLLLAGGLGVVLYFVVPAARPILGMLFKWITSAIPFVGSIVTWIAAKLHWQTPLVQTVTGGQNFKDTITSDTTQGLTQVQKDWICETFNTEMARVQDTSSQQTVKAIKSSL
jgi:hypothetical protein